MGDQKFERDEIERRLKSALSAVLEQMDYDPDLGIDVDGPIAILEQYADGEPIHRFEIRFDIQEVTEA